MIKTVIIEIYKSSPEQLMMNAFYKSESLEHKHYSVHKFNEASIRELCADVFNVINRADSKGLTTKNSLDDLKKSANLLYENILSKEIKSEIKKTDATHLIFYIDEQLVYIPWELLYDGSSYLCLRFATGRVVLTSRQIYSDFVRPVKPHLKMLAVCDPAGDLSYAYQEGIIIRNELDKARNKIRLELRTTDVDSKFVLKNLQGLDMFHFAGHAKYQDDNPHNSGFVLKDGDLTAENLAPFRETGSMPLLVFANACSSGETGSWRVDPSQENKIFGLANIFLLAGAKHYIGTFWKVQDGLSMQFARIFYRNIRMGKSIGEALKYARLLSIEKYGDNALIWASYMLYGDPGDYLVAPEKKIGLKKFATRRNIALLGTALVILAAAAVFHLFSLKEETPATSLNLTPFKNVYDIKEDGTVNKYDNYSVLARNIAFHKKSACSTAQNKYQESTYAFDNNLGTRWASLFSDPQWIYVDLGERLSIGYIKLKWQIAAGRVYDVQVSDDAKHWKTVWRTLNGGGPSDVIDISKKNIVGRYVRIFGKKRTTVWGYSLFEFEVYPNLFPNISTGKKAFASSGSEGYRAEKAVDGSMGTRWGSEYADPQWLYVDLEAGYKIDLIDIMWEYAYGSDYVIQRSDDAKNWVDVCEITDNNSVENHIYFEKPFVARYIRIYGKKRATDWGYSIWELNIHGIKN
ncbi:MAG: discoidin domain-containing protein [Candidatus Omnitrophota bacterium]|nr:discoidin domain-containing protein [Candidatus Omnitrophota bacterium]